MTVVIGKQTQKYLKEEYKLQDILDNIELEDETEEDIPSYLEYEHKLCPVMRGWDAYLRLHYGDYMQCPAELEKRTHLLFSIDFGPYADVPTEELEQSVLQRTQEVSAMTQNVEAEGETLHA